MRAVVALERSPAAPLGAAVLVGMRRRSEPQTEVGEHLEELARLLATAGGRTVARVIVDRDRPDPATLIGRGRAEALHAEAARTGAAQVIFDHDLSPGQIRGLEEIVGRPILDRAALILEIFARRARTREARTQVELARLRHLLPRLTRRWGHFSRQAGGIGARDVGETQLELDRRMARRRIGWLEQELARIDRARAERRKPRRNAFQIALVGYTNAGKTTLLNGLTGARSLAEDTLFATLDPLVRRWTGVPGTTVLVIDTVGFVRDLPHGLIASFRSTLREAAEADLLLHVIDLSHPAWQDQEATSRGVLAELDAGKRPCVEVFNKIDRNVPPGQIERARRLHPQAVFISAASGRGMPELAALLRERVRERGAFGAAAAVVDGGRGEEP
jgi:GTP-binding protein HflX